MAGNTETVDQFSARLDAEDAQFVSGFKAAREEKQRVAMLESVRGMGAPPGTPQGGAVDPETATAVMRWTAKLPKDVGIAVWDNVRNFAELSLDAGAALADAQFQQLAPLAAVASQKAAAGADAYQQTKAEQGTPGAVALRDLQARQGEDLPPNLADVTSMDLRDVAPEFVDSVDKARAWLGQGDNQADIAAQKLFQFAGPFAAALRVTGGLSAAPGVASWLANTGKLAFADFAAAYAAFDPHEARFADLLREYGPDNRLVNSYIDYAVSDKSDTDAEGRWKNAVDNTLAGVPFALGSAVWHSGKMLARVTGRSGNEWRSANISLPAAAATSDRLPVKPEFDVFERQLTPETRTELIAMRADAQAYQPTYKATLEGIAKEVTGDSKNALVPDLKGWARISQKVVTEENGQASGIRDMVRGTILVRNRAEAERVWSALQQQFTSAKDAPRTSLLDGATDSLGYADMKMNIEGPGGRTYEVQVTTPGLWAAKEADGHKFYERWRDIVGRIKSENRPLTPKEVTEKEAIERQSTDYYATAFDSAAFFGGKPFSNTAPRSNRLNEPSGNSSRQSE